MIKHVLKLSYLFIFLLFPFELFNTKGKRLDKKSIILIVESNWFLNMPISKIYNFSLIF